MKKLQILANLTLNVKKSVILTDQIEIKGETEINEIKIVKSFTYLGCKISLSRKQLIDDAIN